LLDDNLRKASDISKWQLPDMFSYWRQSQNVQKEPIPQVQEQVPVTITIEHDLSGEEVVREVVPEPQVDAMGEVVADIAEYVQDQIVGSVPLHMYTLHPPKPIKYLHRYQCGHVVCMSV